ncbi:hypothetical protein ABH935_000664 [Catenulispora sp. GAS73]|uniref:trypco2 family protein n=1 Tax=Catenulispora sp. GAS73 TaxID=3156269 RepID=UPI003515C15E
MAVVNGSDEQWLDLADAIALLRKQIAQAQEQLSAPASGDQGVLFTVGEVTLELGLELTGSKGTKGDLRWGVIAVGGTKDNGQKATHTVTVKLAPHRPGGGDIDVSDDE